MHFFKNWLDTRPKMETHEPSVYPTILGSVLQGFLNTFLDLGARSAIFWHLKTGTSGKPSGNHDDDDDDDNNDDDDLNVALHHVKIGERFATKALLRLQHPV